jgi:DNA repair ATPase RecN
MDLTRYKKSHAEISAKKQLLEAKVKTLGETITSLENQSVCILRAQEIMNIVSSLAQEECKGAIEELVTFALKSVYGDDYSFEIENKIFRNQPETFMYVVINGTRYLVKDVDDHFGGGVADVISFFLRVIAWAIQEEKTDNVLILDEPLKNLDPERLRLCGDSIREIAKSLGLQFIIINRLPQLAEIADVSFIVTKEAGVSHVERVVNETVDTIS